MFIGACLQTSVNAQKTKTSTTSTSSSTKVSGSVNDNNKNYKYTSAFDKSKTEEVRTTIIKELGQPNDSNNRRSVWEGKEYSVELKDGYVTVDLNKEKTIKSVELKLKDLSESISVVVGAPPAPPPPIERPKKPGKAPAAPPPPPTPPAAPSDN